MNELDYTVNNRCREIASTWDNIELARLGTRRFPIWKRILALWYHRSLKTRIIRPNDILTMGARAFGIVRYCMASRFYGSMGIKWTKFVTVRSEKNGNLVIEWV